MRAIDWRSAKPESQTSVELHAVCALRHVDRILLNSGGRVAHPLSVPPHSLLTTFLNLMAAFRRTRELSGLWLCRSHRGYVCSDPIESSKLTAKTTYNPYDTLASYCELIRPSIWSSMSHRDRGCRLPFYRTIFVAISPHPPRCARSQVLGARS